MVKLTDAQFEAAEARGAAARLNEPRATAARFDAKTGRFVVDLTNGCTFMFPQHLAQGLEDASPTKLAAVEVLGSGTGLHWEDLDVDLSVPGLLAGLFGTKAYMARLAGQTTSEAKAAAARANGARGGRPPKLSIDGDPAPAGPRFPSHISGRPLSGAGKQRGKAKSQG